AMLRLQHILFLRELGLSLEDIQAVVDRPDFDLLASLEAHRSALRTRARRLEEMMKTVDRTILHLKGRLEMENKDLFGGFSEEKQKEYEEQARLQYGESELYAESQRRWKRYTKEQKQEIFDEGNRVYRDLIAAIPLGVGSEEVQACIARWHQHLRYFYEPTPEVLRGLGDLYNEQPEFKANFDRMDSRLAPFMHEAIQIYVERL
ncbi:MAG: TipAS antibiotic-recognition domain-containing protein, partial [Anaerolineaceae bacterium]